MIIYTLLFSLSYSFILNYNYNKLRLPKNIHFSNINSYNNNIITYKDNITNKFKTYNFSNQTLHFEEYFISQNTGCPGYFYF